MGLKIVIFLIMSIFSFFLSIDGILSNKNFPFFIILCIFGFSLFTYSVIYTIKNKRINYFIFTPIILILFIIIGTNIGQIKYNRIYKIAGYISENYYIYTDDDFEDIFKNVKIPKNMKIINGNNGIIIIYKNLIYSVDSARFLDLDIERKGTIEIIDSNNNRYLGYIYYENKDENHSRKLWIINSYVYERYVVNQMCYGNHPAGVSIYEKNSKTDIVEYINKNEIYITYEHYLIGIYDNFLFLLSMGNSPTFRDFKIVDLNNNEIIYSGQYIWEIGINFIEPYSIEIYEYYNESIYENVNNYIKYKFVFDQYSFNLKTGEKNNLNKRIEIIGE